MAIKRYKAEQIVTLLRQIEVGIGNGKPTPQACNEAAITMWGAPDEHHFTLQRTGEMGVQLLPFSKSKGKSG
jgi:hypothetical protein